MLLSRIIALSNSGWLNRVREGQGDSILYYSGEAGDQATVKDMSGSGNNGTITGATWKTLPSGLPYLDFNGTSNKVVSVSNLPASVIGTNSRYLEFWAKMDAETADHQDIAVFGVEADSTNFGAIILHQGGADHWYFWGGGASDIDTGVDVTFAVWQHHLLGFDTAGNKIYWFINGAAIIDGTVKNLINTSASPLYLGTHMAVGDYWIDGGIALPRLSSTAPSLALATNHFNRERGFFNV
jgi:hypothetical protein